MAQSYKHEVTVGSVTSIGPFSWFEGGLHHWNHVGVIYICAWSIAWRNKCSSSVWVDQRGLLGAIENDTRCYINEKH